MINYFLIYFWVKSAVDLRERRLLDLRRPNGDEVYRRSPLYNINGRAALIGQLHMPITKCPAPSCQLDPFNFAFLIVLL